MTRGPHSIRLRAAIERLIAVTRGEWAPWTEEADVAAICLEDALAAMDEIDGFWEAYEHLAVSREGAQ